MKRLMTLAVAAVMAFSVTNFAFAQKVKSMKIVSFTGQVQIKLKDGSIIGVVPNAKIPDIPAGAEVIVVSGEAVFQAGDTVVTAAKGDSFSFNTSGNSVTVAATGSNTNLKVAVGGAEAAVKSGSSVAVKTTGKKAEISVASGSVAVTSGGTTQTLSEGQSTTTQTSGTSSSTTQTQTTQTTTDSTDTGTTDAGTTDSGTTTTVENPSQNIQVAPPSEISPSSP